ncbi:protein of unknown function [Methylotuvimicrobium alcaliphilum 20Z]|uniref:Uncharacterized protein n=1 Tax=Methylotuvimicrobium alcaliphilum (strain DSM 19304 / NCIMB 14124 / VKM B-2133 / 20Z) TaxID=1091494 RepID=G4T164_META2|nr:protein of unknown function [Methylotuvimicrobium alcaliphilum 20Z]
MTLFIAAIPSLNIFSELREWSMPVKERREPILGGLTAALPAADILAKHTPHPFLHSNWELLLSIELFIRVRRHCLEW